jgi:hypothetical protein
MNKIIVTIAICFFACGPYPPPEPTPGPEPEPIPDPISATCTEVCVRGDFLNCKWAQPTPGGASCVEVCENVQTSGIVQWDLGCRAAARSCAEVEACED